MSTRTMQTGALFLGILLLLVTANGSPVLATRFLKAHLSAPVDGGYRLADGQPVFGPSKTVRGLVVSIGSTTVVALLLGFEASVGVSIALGAMAGDLASSFVKRRLQLEPHAPAFLLDQIPEGLLPLLLVQDHLGLSGSGIAALLLAFVTLQLGLSRLLFWLGIRDRPY